MRFIVIILLLFLMQGCIPLFQQRYVGEYISARNNFSNFDIKVNYSFIPDSMDIVFVDNEIMEYNENFQPSILEDYYGGFFDEFIFIERVRSSVELHVFHNVLVIDVQQIVDDSQGNNLSRHLRHFIKIYEFYQGSYDAFIDSVYMFSLDGTYTNAYYEVRSVKSQQKYPIIAYVEKHKDGNYIDVRVKDRSKTVGKLFLGAAIPLVIVFSLNSSYRKEKLTQEIQDDYIKK